MARRPNHTADEADKPVKALVVRRPWAELIASGLKDVENRSRCTSYRGWLLVVAGKVWEPAAVAFAAERGVTVDPDPSSHPVGAVAVVNVAGVCSAAVDGSGCDCDHWAQPGQHHWRWSSRRRLLATFPVPKVMPGLWTPPPEVREEVCRQTGLVLLDRHDSEER